MRRTLIHVHPKKEAPRFRRTLGIVERAYSRGADVKWRMILFGIIVNEHVCAKNIV